MQHNIKITIQHKNYEWGKGSSPFEHGITIAQNLQEKLGLKEELILFFINAENRLG